MYWKPARNVVKLPGFSSSTSDLRASTVPSPGRVRPRITVRRHVELYQTTDMTFLFVELPHCGHPDTAVQVDVELNP